MAFKELVSPTLKELFIKEIESMILSGDLKIGDKLPPERELAEKMKVSQAVINGGVTELANKGFLEIIPRKGTYVADYKREGKLEILEAILEYNGGHFDPVMMESLLEVREDFERTAASSAARKASQEDIAGLREKLTSLDHSRGPKQVSNSTVEFYRELSIISGNIIHPLIFHAFKSLYFSLAEVLYKGGFSSDEADLLHKLVDLIEQRKPAEAADCVTEKINWLRNTFNNNFTAGQII
jgi:GntR family transcriptional regulator, transcriptional repressor for pyruvate dehydrogenase complex